jgi:hypothetical protein
MHVLDTRYVVLDTRYLAAVMGPRPEYLGSNVFEAVGVNDSLHCVCCVSANGGQIVSWMMKVPVYVAVFAAALVN